MTMGDQLIMATIYKLTVAPGNEARVHWCHQGGFPL